MFRMKDLFDRLLDEQSEEHWYRGEPREYPAPLWPSRYRTSFRSEDCIQIASDLRIRKKGEWFYFRTSYLDRSRHGTDEQYVEALKEEQIRLFIAHQTRNALGYVLGETLLQQAGLGSEGLDVTTDLRVAAFFSCYEWNGSHYQRKSATNAPSVLYRWKIPLRNWSIDDLNTFDYYSSPYLLPTKDLLALFDPATSRTETTESMDDYQKAIDWHVYKFDLAKVRGKRPFDKLRFMTEHIAQSRLVRQSAGLLLPDAVHGDVFVRNYGARSAEEAKELSQGAFVEDMARNDVCEKFVFLVDEDYADQLIGGDAPRDLFPDRDIMFTLLRGWIRRFLSNPFDVPYGATPLLLGPGVPDQVDWLEILDSILKGETDSIYFP